MAPAASGGGVTQAFRGPVDGIPSEDTEVDHGVFGKGLRVGANRQVQGRALGNADGHHSSRLQRLLSRVVAPGGGRLNLIAVVYRQAVSVGGSWRKSLACHAVVLHEPRVNLPQEQRLTVHAGCESATTRAASHSQS